MPTEWRNVCFRAWRKQNVHSCCRSAAIICYCLSSTEWCRAHLTVTTDALTGEIVRETSLMFKNSFGLTAGDCSCMQCNAQFRLILWPSVVNEMHENGENNISNMVGDVDTSFPHRIRRSAREVHGEWPAILRSVGWGYSHKVVNFWMLNEYNTLPWTDSRLAKRCGERTTGDKSGDFSKICDIIACQGKAIYSKWSAYENIK